MSCPLKLIRRFVSQNIPDKPVFVPRWGQDSFSGQLCLWCNRFMVDPCFDARGRCQFLPRDRLIEMKREIKKSGETRRVNRNGVPLI